MKRLGPPSMLLLGLLLVACASRTVQVRSEPPTLQLEGLVLAEDRVRLTLLVHNPNDHALALRGVSLVMRIDGTEVFADDWPLDLDFGPRLNERLRLETRASAPASRRLLERNWERDSTIGYTLEVAMRVEGRDEVTGDLSDYLHAVPGQPGRFR